jgi:ribonuclease PH
MNTIEKYLSQMAKDALDHSVRLDLYPKMVISITMVLLKSSGNTGTDLAALITCGSLALIDASVETIDLVTSSSVAVSENSQEFIVEPTIFNPVRGTMTVATLVSLKKISQLYSEGRIDADVMPSLISTACRAAEEMRSRISEFCKTSS